MAITGETDESQINAGVHSITPPLNSSILELC